MDLAGWCVDRFLGLPAGGAHPVEVERDLRIPLPDGAVLLADRYRPRGAGPLPAVLLRSPYGRGAPYAQMLARPLARRGWQVVLQSVRGTFGSSGDFVPFVGERDDGLATIAWLRTRPWCDGRVAMAGQSYLGYAQWAVGGYLAEPLAAMAVALAGSQFHTGDFTGGAFQLHASLSWVALLARQERALMAGLLPNPLRDRRERRGMRRLPLRDADRVATGRRLAAWSRLVDHAEPDDAVWAPADHSGAVAAVRAPVSMVAGWRDVFLPCQLRDFQALRERGERVRLTVGPWGHNQLAGLRAVLRDQLDWFDRWLGPPGPAGPEEPPVRVFLQQGGRWLTFAEWPPAARAVTWYLGGFARLRRMPGTGGVDRFVYRPDDPTPTVGGPSIAGRSARCSNGPLESRPDVLRYTGPVLERDLDVVGEVSVELHVRSDSSEGQVFARLCDVDEAGRSWDVCDGLLRLGRAGTVPDPDGTLRARVTLWPTAYRFRRGHRLRLLVAGGCFPRYPRDHGAVAAVSCGEPVRYAVLHGSCRPSGLVIPVLDQAAAEPGLVRCAPFEDRLAG
jgi:putative CocE/NonD family hydrolase